MYGDSISETRKIMNSVVQLNSVDEFITEQNGCLYLCAITYFAPSLFFPPSFPPSFISLFV